MNLHHKQRQVMKHYGLNHQQKKLCEEMRELAHEIEFGENLGAFKSELADVLNVAEQLKFWCGDAEIEKIQNEKMDRQLNRIAKGE